MFCWAMRCSISASSAAPMTSVVTSEWRLAMACTFSAACTSNDTSADTRMTTSPRPSTFASDSRQRPSSPSWLGAVGWS